MDKVNLAQKFSLFDEHWTPKIVEELNGQHVKLAKLEGEFGCHAHKAEDELVMVIKGQLVIRLRNRDSTLGEGEFAIVPRGVEHCPVALEEVHVLMFEPISTSHTGNVRTDKTVDELETI